MKIFEMAAAYYPRLWDKSRLEALVAAGRLTEEEAEKLIRTPDSK
ncbi:XkdX family protein [Pseudoflavonifractor sp. 524-17]|nr:XkdX family protein [Pseudoflavonifractor sp. 524-17]NCE65391.1 XkdX family protein [Pseudoflavonifractor sp. 524-17]